MSDPYTQLAELGLQLPTTSLPGGSYTSVNIRASIAYVAIQFPIWNEEYRYRGRLGTILSTEDGWRAMQLCGLNVLAQIDSKVGFDQLLGLNHLDIYFQAAPDWDDSPAVADGASELFMAVLGQQGQHSRTIIGVERLPRNFSVGLTASFTLLASRSGR